MPNIRSYLREVGDKLRTCQIDAVTQFAAFERNKNRDPDKSFLVNLPTGAGKTGVIAMIAHLSSTKRTLVVCHRSAVKQQLIRDVSTRFFREILLDENFKLKQSHSDDDFDQGSGIYVTTFQKLARLDGESLDFVHDSFDLIIVDEGHSEPSPVWRELVRKSEAMKVVVTATPYRNDLFQLNVDTKQFYVYTFRQAAQAGVVLEPLIEQVEDDARMIERISTILRDDDSIKCIVKCKSAQDIIRYHNLFSAKFITASIHDRFAGEEDKHFFTEVRKALLVKKVRILIHQHKLDEGVDIPEAKVLALTYELGSGRELVQSIGRIVRAFDGSPPTVLDLSMGTNEGMWEGYRKFDNYLSNGGAAPFIRSLSTSHLIQSYLDAFPEHSYFDGGFRERVSLSNIDHESDIRIPSASVSFVQKAENFSMSLLLDRKYWELHSAGYLVNEPIQVHDLSVILYVSFASSKYFSSKFFFEPKLQLIVVKEMTDGLAVFDSESTRYYNRKEYRLGASIQIEKLAALATRTKSNRVKETHARAIGQALQRPEGVALKGPNLNNSRADQSNSRYALTMVMVDNIDIDGSKSSSYYLGARSGRVVDQLESNFTLSEFSAWIDEIEECMHTGSGTSSLIRSYAQPISDIPATPILSVLIDFTDLQQPLQVGKGSIPAEFVYIDYDDGMSLPAGSSSITFDLSLDSSTLRFEAQATGESIDDASHQRVLDHINHGSRLKVLYEDGTTYIDGKFYSLSLPYDLGIVPDQSFTANAVVPVSELLNKELTEKGFTKDSQYINTTPDSFDKDSIFHLIDLLKGYGDPKSTVGSLGPFANHLPGCDFVLCCDMGTEPADFIVSSPDKLCFVHIKCGKTLDPRSAAGAIAEVGSQAIKNIYTLISSNDAALPGNFASWNDPWPSSQAKHRLNTRFRLFNGNINHTPNAGKTDPAAAWDLISRRRRSLRCKKEIWVVTGNSFSRKHFIDAIGNPDKANAESTQAFQLIQNWLGTADEMDFAVRLFTSL